MRLTESIFRAAAKKPCIFYGAYSKPLDHACVYRYPRCREGLRVNIQIVHQKILAKNRIGMKEIDELREEEIEYCRTHIQYFIDTYGHIEDKDADELIQPFGMWKEQREALESIMAHRWNVILKARQLGFSWLVMHIVAHLLLTSSGKSAIGLSKTEEEAKELVRRLGVILRYMPELVQEKDFEEKGWSGPIFRSTALSLSIKFPDGTESTFKALASSPGAGRSFTVNLIVFDEWAFQQFAREIWQGGFPTINRPSGGKVIGLSTIERGSLFEEIFTDPDNGFNKIFIPWYADPRRDAEWYEKTRRALGDLITEEYPASIEEALMVPGGAMFPEVRRATHEDEEAMEGAVKRICAIDYGLDALAAVFITINTEGQAQGYREVKQPNLTISQACGLLLRLSADEYIEQWLAPDDLWNRRQETGKSAADIFIDNGINLIKVNRDMFNGCMALKEELMVREDTGRPNLTFLKGTCDETIRCLQKIQKDKNKPTVYAKTPHDLTHLVDALRYYATYWNTPAKKPKRGSFKRWSADLLEDYKNANKEIKALMIKKLGEPIR